MTDRSRGGAVRQRTEHRVITFGYPVHPCGSERLPMAIIVYNMAHIVGYSSKEEAARFYSIFLKSRSRPAVRPRPPGRGYRRALHGTPLQFFLNCSKSDGAVIR